MFLRHIYRRVPIAANRGDRHVITEIREGGDDLRRLPGRRRDSASPRSWLLGRSSSWGVWHAGSAPVKKLGDYRWRTARARGTRISGILTDPRYGSLSRRSSAPPALSPMRQDKKKNRTWTN